MLSNEEGKNIIEAAFKPLECEVEVGIDFGRLFKFQVFNSERGAIYQVRNTHSDVLKSEELLRKILKDARKAVKEKGYTLDPWEL